MAQSVYPVPESGGIPTGITNDRPASPATGDVFYDGTVGALMIWDGSNWVPCSAPASAPSISVADVGTSIAYGSAQAAVTFTEGTVGGSALGYTTSSSTGGYTSTSTSESFNITVGNPGSWTFTGTAYNAFGTSPTSSSVTQTLTTVPQAPTIVSAATTATTDITVTWTLNSNGGKALSSITVTPYLNGTTAGTPQNASTASSTSMTFTGLTPASTYTFKVKTTNANGTGLESAATNSVIIPSLIPVQYLVIAGGGGGANRSYRSGGGGGAGGYRTSTLNLFKGVNQTTTVGAGGGHATAGNNSVFSTITSTGGGYGAYGGDGGAGGSGGGGCAANTADYAGNPTLGGAASPAGQGNAGGNANAGSTTGAGGGGGAGAVGNVNNGSSGGAGGDGLASSITGTSVTRAGGGGGGKRGSGSHGAGGSGGGGSGEYGTGQANTGSGGGGTNQEGNTGYGYGGSGLVILRYLTSDGTITIGAGLTGSTATDGSYKVTTITAGTGNVSWA